jgi:16S rRNA (guanine527-N7)-methyltransferase
LRPQLDAGLAALALQPSASQRTQLLALVPLLVKWSRAYNLTAVRAPADMVTRHLLDSLAAAPFVRGERVLDVGTGAGFPGLPLAIVQPDRAFVLLDSHAKKLRFVDHAVDALGLGNVRSVHARVERYSDEAGFDTVICRAFSSLADFVQGAGHLLAPGGVLLALKGRLPDDELAALPAGWRAQAEPLEVPGLHEARHAIEITKI